MSHYSTTSWRFASTNVADSPDQHLLHTMATPAASSSSHDTAAATGRAQTYPASADARLTSGAAGGHHTGDSLFVSPPSPSLHGAQAGNTSLFSPSFSPVRFDSEPEEDDDDEEHAQHARQQRNESKYHEPVGQQQQQSGQQAVAPQPASVPVSIAPAEEEDSDDDEAYLLSRMARTKAALAARTGGSIVPPFRAAPSATAAAATATATQSAVPSMQAQQPRSSSTPRSVSFAEQPEQLEGSQRNAGLSASALSQSHPAAAHRGSVSSVSSDDPFDSPHRVRGAQRAGMSSSHSQRTRPAFASSSSSARARSRSPRFASPFAAAAEEQHHDDHSRSQPAATVDVSLQDLLRDLPASSTPGDLRMRISVLREALTRSSASASALSDRVSDLEAQLAQL
jgi:hypothetical protein